jgi:hypothetical protein
MSKLVYSRICILSLFIAVISINIQAQTTKIVFEYDENGNRTSRVLVTEQLKSAIIDFPINDNKKLELAKDKKDQFLDLETNIKVYPNPTKGLLRIEISDLPDGASTQLQLFDYSGFELIDHRNIPPSQELDISRYKDGLFILRIIINTKVSNWKIVKYAK